MTIKFYVTENGIAPRRANELDAGIDLFAAEDVLLMPLEVVQVDVGCGFQLPALHYGQIHDRSSMAAKGIITVGGVIDETYTKPIRVLMFTLQNPYQIRRGDKIAQLVIHRISNSALFKMEEVDINISDRGGFGSTGER